MNALTPSREEQAEVAAILESGIFRRAPLLENFFRYVCERYFEGQSESIKEYSIAVEALGRAPGFDPKKDSIVRVEAHHLRKRLHQYYAGQGVNHSVRIKIPQGQYVPQFVRREAEAKEAPPIRESPALDLEIAPVAEIAPLSAPKEANPGAPGKLRGWILLAAAAALVSTAALLVVLFSHQRSNQAVGTANELWKGTNAPGPVPMEYRILAGYHGAAFSDANGNTWNPDAHYTGGISALIPASRFIEGQPEPHFLKSQRTGTFRYDIPLRRGVYEVHLYFAETQYGSGNPLGGGEATRTFQLSVNNVAGADSIDPLAEAGGPNRLHVRVLKDVSPAPDGKLHLAFRSVDGAGLLNALEILPSVPGRIRPVRIVTQPKPVVDPDGHIWLSDRYFVGGTQVLRRESVTNLVGKSLFQGERYGNFAYHIPLAPGKYHLTLHFAETWFGTPDSGQPVDGRRIFDVYANGVALLKSFEVAREAGGTYRGVREEFDGLEPNAHGILVLEFVPSRNYAEVNAIEVVETD